MWMVLAAAAESAESRPRVIATTDGEGDVCDEIEELFFLAIVLDDMSVQASC